MSTKSSISKPSKSTNKLIIGLVIDDSLDRPDGVQQYVLTLGAWLTSQGHEVHYITSTTLRVDIPNIHVVGRSMGVQFNGNRLRTPLPASRTAIRYLFTAIKFDVIHVQMPYSPLLGGQVLKMAAIYAPSARRVATFHIFPDSALVHHGSRLLAFMQKRQYRLLDDVLSVSTAAQRFARLVFGVESRVVPNGVLLEPFTKLSQDDKEPSGRDFTKPFTITFLGRLVERKGCRQLLHAIASSRDRLPEALLVRIGGRGPQLISLQQEAAKLGIGKDVVFEGFVAEEAKASFLANADMIVLPSLGGESFGISVVEALAASRGPVLAGDNPGYRTVMLGLAKQLVRADDPEGAFADKVAYYANMSRHDRDRAVDAQHRLAQQFAIGTVGPRILAAYETTLHMPRT